MPNTAKKPNTSPESYGPKRDRPLIMNMAKEVNDKADNIYTVKTENDGSYIDRFPHLRWGEWKDCAYCGSIAAVADVLGIPASYEYIMGVSGICYRFAMKDSWCPSASLPQNGFVRDDVINAALGIKVYAIADGIERDTKVKACLDAGIPVTCMGQIGSPEWGVITGYAEEGKVFFGRSYFDAGDNYPTDTFYTDNKYRHAKNYPGTYPAGFLKFYDKKCEKVSSTQSLKTSLETCLSIFEQRDFGGCKFGYAAYDILINGLVSGKEEAEGGKYHVGILLDCRRAAHKYLEQCIDLLSDANRDKLKTVSELYNSMVEAILNVVLYEHTSASFNGKEDTPAWDRSTRNELAAALRKVVQLEKEVRVVVEDLLENWE